MLGTKDCHGFRVSIVRIVISVSNVSSLWDCLQSGASSQAKHGGAYFSAVYGSIEDPLAAPGPYENLGPPFLGGSAQPVTFVLPLTHAHTASAPQRALQQDLFWNRSNVFVTKQIHETCFRTNPAGMPIDER